MTNQINTEIEKQIVDTYINTWYKKNKRYSIIAKTFNIFLPSGKPNKMAISRIIKKYKKYIEEKEEIENKRESKIYGYCRINPLEKEEILQEQINKLIEKGVLRENIYIDKVQGNLSSEELETHLEEGHFCASFNLTIYRPELDKLWQLIKPRDTIYVVKWYRLTTQLSLNDAIIIYCNQRKINIIALDDINGEDTSRRMSIIYASKNISEGEYLW